MDNSKNTGHPDRDLINLNQNYEVRYWTKKWGITPDQLKEAAKKVQPSESVRKIHDAVVSLGYMKPKL